MIIANRAAISKFMKKHANSRASLSAWVNLVEQSDWATPAHVKRDFSTASFLSDNKVVFNIGGNNFRIVVVIVYVNGILAVKWIGTHAEYDKKKF